MFEQKIDVFNKSCVIIRSIGYWAVSLKTVPNEKRNHRFTLRNVVIMVLIFLSYLF